jgi:hypothetical protein
VYFSCSHSFGTTVTPFHRPNVLSLSTFGGPGTVINLPPSFRGKTHSVSSVFSLHTSPPLVINFCFHREHRIKIRTLLTVAVKITDLSRNRDFLNTRGTGEIICERRERAFRTSLSSVKFNTTVSFTFSNLSLALTQISRAKSSLR